MITDSLPIDRPTGLAIIILAGALFGLIWGKKIWAVVDRKAKGGWGAKPERKSDDADSNKRRDEENHKH